MKSIIFNNNNSNGSSWKKQAMLVNILALSIIVLLLLIEQVNTKEVNINVDLKDEATKDESTKAGELLHNDEQNLEHLSQMGEGQEEKEKVPDAAAATAGLLSIFLFFVVPYLLCSGCVGAIVYCIVKAIKEK